MHKSSHLKDAPLRNGMDEVHVCTGEFLAQLWSVPREMGRVKASISGKITNGPLWSELAV